MTEFNIGAAQLRVIQIDAMLEDQTGWGSWVVEAANERENLVNQLRLKGYDVKHKHLSRTSNGGRVS